jgi:hypothetical protein
VPPGVAGIRRCPKPMLLSVDEGRIQLLLHSITDGDGRRDSPGKLQFSVDGSRVRLPVLPMSGGDA